MSDECLDVMLIHLSLSLTFFLLQSFSRTHPDHYDYCILGILWVKLSARLANVDMNWTQGVIDWMRLNDRLIESWFSRQWQEKEMKKHICLSLLSLFSGDCIIIPDKTSSLSSSLNSSSHFVFLLRSPRPFSLYPHFSLLPSLLLYWTHTLFVGEQKTGTR